MGTLIGITIYAKSVNEAKAAFRAAFARISRLNQALSDYIPNSELNQISTTPRVISRELEIVLGFAQTLARRTGGAFDITAGALIRHWRKTKTLPLPDNIISGYQHLHLNKGVAWVDDPRIRLDLGAIGKGYAADCALDELKERGISRALIAVSGDVVCGAPPAGRSKWSITAAGQEHQITHAAVSTSGDAEQFTMVNGHRYSHILDPRTRLPLKNSRQVTVISRKGIESDALATALAVLGDDQLLKDHYPYARALFTPS